MNSGQYTKGRNNPNKILPVMGRMYGELEVISEDIKYSKDGRSIWTLRCSCGTTQDILAKGLRRSTNPRIMCTRCSKSAAGIDRMKRLISTKKRGSHSGLGTFTRTHYCYFKRNCKRGKTRTLNWDLSVEYLWNLFMSQDSKCALTGIPLEFGELGDMSRVQHSKMTASLDRIDSSIGYVKGNVQWLHKHINVMKHSHDQSYFIKLCNLVSEYGNPEPSLSRNTFEGATTR